MGNFVLQKDPIHFLLGCLILISLFESGFRVIYDQVLLCQDNRKCQAARTMMANLTWRHCANRSEGSALNSLNFFCKYLQRIYTQAPCRLFPENAVSAQPAKPPAESPQTMVGTELWGGLHCADSYVIPSLPLPEGSSRITKRRLAPSNEIQQFIMSDAAATEG